MVKYMGRVVGLTWLLLLCSSGSYSAWAIDASIEKQLLDKSSFWQKRGDTYKAKKALKKLLFLDPNNPKALTKLGEIALKEGHKETAVKYLGMLNSSHPNNKASKKLHHKINSLAGSKLLEKAREAAAHGAFLDSVHYYQQFFKKHALKDNLAFEYYRTAAAVPSYWEFSRLGYERLVKKNPGNSTYAFALAEHLTFRKETRLQGIQALASMSHHQKNRRKVLKAWRKALLWLPINPSSVDAYDVYLKQVGSDKKISSLMQQAIEAPKDKLIDIQKKQAFEQLNHGSIKKAEVLFSDLLQKHKKDADINGGMGVTFLKMRRFSEAERFLKQAIQLNPRGAKHWQDAYQSAQYWNNLASSKRDIQQQHFGYAERKIKQAIRIQPKEIQGYLSLAQLQSQRGNDKQAMKTLEKALTLAPHNYALRLALTRLHVKQHAPQALEEALVLLEEYPAESGNSQVFMQAYMQDKKQGFDHRVLTQRAKVALEQHVIANPEDLWARMDLAKMYRYLNQQQKALSLLTGLIRDHPNMIEPRYMAAQIYMETKAWSKAELILQGLSEKDMPDSLRSLKQTIRIKKSIQKARLLAQGGRKAEAIALLNSAETYKKNMSMDNLTALANAWAEVDMPYRSLAIGRRIMHTAPKNDYDARLSYISILIATHESAEADIWLANLMKDRAKMNQKQQAILMNLAQGQAIYHSDQARLAKGFAQAWDYLAPYLKKENTDSNILLAEARIFHDAKRDKEALKIYERLFKRDPKNPDILEPAIYSALAMKDFRLASRLIKKGIQIEPEKPRFYMLLAQKERLQGHQAKALKALLKARKIQGLELEQNRIEPKKNTPLDHNRLENPFLNTLKHDTQGLTISRSEPLKYSAYSNVISAPSRRNNHFELSMDTSLYHTSTLPPNMQSMDTSQLSDASIRHPMLIATLEENNNNPFIHAKTSEVPRVLANHQAPRTALDVEIEEIKSKLSTTVSVGLDIHDRKGEGGLSMFNTIELPLEVKLHPLGNDLTLRMVPVLLSAGTLNMNNINVSNRFGSNILVGRAQATQLPQRGNGVALHAAYGWETLKVDIGVSPLGLPISNFIGGISFHPKINNQLSLELALNRRSVTDTLLSYAGVFDPVTKSFWGGVVKNSFDAAFDVSLSNELGIYGKANIGRLSGKNVASNSVFGISTGAFYPFFKQEHAIFRAGVNLSLESYKRNLGYYTLGHGGYFSPQRYITLAFPMTLKGSEGALSYQVGGYLGWQTFQEDGAAYFPNNPTFQAFSGKLYPSRNTASFFMGIEGSAEYVLSSQWSLGGHIGFDNAQNYKLLAISTYLHYRFDGFIHLPDFSLSPLQGFYEESL